MKTDRNTDQQTDQLHHATTPPNGLKFLVLGSGGREHALAWRLSTAPQHQVFAVPGNPGIAEVATCLPGNLADFDQLKQLCLDHQIDIVVVGPEQPLVDGVADYFAADSALAHVALLGPDKACAQLEGSKAFSKAFMARHNIPTARYAEFDQHQLDACLDYLTTHPLPIVVKADGLAAGKGVIIAQTVAEAQAAVTDMLTGAAFGEAGLRVVIEAFLEGIEMSYFVMADGTGHYLTLPQAKDYKRIGVGDTGPNTGGMGTVSPVPFATDSLLSEVDATIVKPTLDGLKAEGLHYKGFLFIGLMVDLAAGHKPYVIEYNCRLGDPETQSLMMRLGPDFADAVAAAARGQLATYTTPLHVSNDPVCTVILASGGYPAAFVKGHPITGLDQVTTATIFHAGTSLNAAGQLINTGGRVLAITATAADWPTAIDKAQQAAHTIQWQDRYFRSDIGRDVVLM